MNQRERHSLFSELIASHQSELYGYIFAVVRDWQDADDLFQSLCVVLWRKFDSFQPGSCFLAWARQAARLEVSNYLRRKRSLNCVSDRVLNTLTAVSADAEGDNAQHLVALRHCRAKLPVADEELLSLRYIDELSVLEIAERLQRLQPSISRSLNRIRHWLLNCVQLELAQQDHSCEEQR
jgi:RNA polymerase sigma-70 factor (ECF subfamily)